MSTFFNAPTQEIGGGGLSSREGKRNRKTQALSALLSASALGLFLEGCGSGPSGSGGGGGSGLGSQRTQTGGTGEDIYVLVSSDNVLISDSDTSGTGTVTFLDANLVAFDTNLIGTAYSSSGDFTFTRSGENLFIDAVSIDGQGPIRVEIEDYFLRPSAFVFSYNSSTSADTVVPTFFDVPSNVATASALSASVASLSDAGSVTLIVGSEDGEELLGSEGNDILQGLGGDDTLNGGTGADTYVFGEGNGEGEGADTIVEVAEEGVVNTLRFEGDYEVSDFSFARSSEDGTDLVIVADTDDDGQAENEITLDGYFVSETSAETAYSIELQINDEEVFVPSVEG